MTIVKWNGGHVEAMRTAFRDTQEQFAGRLGVSVAVVGKWETRGDTQTLGPRFAEMMDTAYKQVKLDPQRLQRFTAALTDGPVVAETDATADVEQAEQNGGATEPPLSLVTSDSASIPDIGGDTTKRRDVLQMIGLTARTGLAEFMLSDARQSAALANRIARPALDPIELTDAADDLRNIATDYALTPDLPRIFIELGTLREQLAALRDFSARATEIRELDMLLAATCALLASVSHDLAQPHAAALQARTAARFADLSGFRPLQTWVSCTRAMIAAWWGTPKQVLAQVDRTPAVYGIGSVRLAGLEARAHAKLGDRHSAHRAIQRARSERDQLGEDGLSDLGPVFSFSIARQHYYDATTHAQLGDWLHAQREAEQVIDLYAPSPAQAWPVTLTLSQATVSRCRTHLEGPRAGLEALRPVLALPTEQRIPQVVNTVAAIRADLANPRLATASASRELASAVSEFAPTQVAGDTNV